MKKLFFSLAIILAFVACKTNNDPKEPELAEKTISFEKAKLDANNVMFNASYTEDILTFSNYFDADYLYWEDFAISAIYDDTTSGYVNMFGSVAASAYDGNNFAVIYQGYYGLPTISAKQDFKPQSVYVNNSTYCYFSLLNGDSYARKFAAGDYFYMTATGYDANDKETGHVDFYLADFREGKSLIVKDWTLFDLSSLGTCRSIKFTFTSTDTGESGMNTPATAIIDKINIKY